MKKIILPLLLIISISAQAQLGGFINKVKDKTKKEEKKDEKKDEKKEEKKDEKKDEKENKTVSKNEAPKPKSKEDTPESRMKTDSITSTIHAKYLNKIVFATDVKSLEKQKEIESDFKTEFNFGEPIYFRAFMDNSMFNYVRPLVSSSWDNELRNNITYAFKVYIDNVMLENLTSDILSRREFENSEKDKLTTFKGALKSSDNSLFIGMNMFRDVLIKHENKLSIGKHKLKIEIYPYYHSPGKGENIKGNTVASGEITLNVKTSVIDLTDTRMCMPNAVMQDKELTNRIASDYFKAYQVKADAVKILSSKWEVQRNKYTSVIERRTLDVSIGYKDPKTNLCYKRNYLINQEYVGGKFLDGINFFTDMQNPELEISCKCLQKK
jgi:hypothetical protein